MNKKKILFVTQYFYPEDFKGNDIAFDLARENEVTVITAVPNYPQGSFFEGYGTFKKTREFINGVKIIRVPIISRGNAGALRLLLNYFSYVITASIYILKLALTEKFNLVFVQQLSPVTMALPGVLYKKIRKVPMFLWVLDLWPESLQYAGGVNNQLILGFFNRIVKSIYNNSTKILISSKAFKNSIFEKGISDDKLIYFPNWAEEIFEGQDKQEEDIPILLSGFIVMFAGNIGESQDFNSIMRAALLLKSEKNIKFIIIGDGRKKSWVDSFIIENQLENTVQMLGRFPLNSMPSFFAKADLMIVSLKDESIFSLTAPAKIQAYMASSKPIIAILNGEGAALIREADCGTAVCAGDYESLAKEIIRFKELPSDKLKKFGENGRIYYNRYFSKQFCLNNLHQFLDLK
ncbi:MAG: glycosyltransferase family 4 protein [Bacteroidales bacterium]